MVIQEPERGSHSRFCSYFTFFFSLFSTNAAAAETLPTPAAQVGLGQQARNYVAYIPVPINGGDDDDDEYYYDDDDEEDEEYYDEDDDYYEDDYEVTSFCTNN